jgi:2-isopropylmalate synthase
MAGNRLTIFDTTLRDGEQAPGYSMRIHEKVRLAKQLDRLGADLIEAGFPIASDADAEAVKAVAAAVRRPSSPAWPGPAPATSSVLPRR